MIAQVILKVVLVFGDERALGTLQALVVFDVNARVLPVRLLCDVREQHFCGVANSTDLYAFDIQN